MTIHYDVQEAVGLVTLDRPEKKNALSLEMRTELINVLERAGSDRTVRAVILRGEGAAFCSGSDVGAMPADAGIAIRQDRLRLLHRIITLLDGMEKPVIAAVDGAAVGFGWSMALACDFVIATPNARFSQIFRNIGFAPDGGSIYYLARQIGLQRAKDIVYTGRFVSAAEAERLGLVLRTVERDAFDHHVQAFARELAAGPTLAVAFSKRMFAASVSPGLQELLQLEHLIQPQLGQSWDHGEGVRAFKEKRPPVFRGE